MLFVQAEAQEKRRKEPPASGPAIGETGTQRVRFAAAPIRELARCGSDGSHRVVSGMGSGRNFHTGCGILDRIWVEWVISSLGTITEIPANTTDIYLFLDGYKYVTLIRDYSNL